VKKLETATEQHVPSWPAEGAEKTGGIVNPFPWGDFTDRGTRMRNRATCRSVLRGQLKVDDKEKGALKNTCSHLSNRGRAGRPSANKDGEWVNPVKNFCAFGHVSGGAKFVL